VLAGHLQQVNCVAFSRGPNSKIVSGSEEGVVRIWEQLPDEERWQERQHIDMGSPVRALTTSGPKASKNLLATATSRGNVHVFDLDALKGSWVAMKERHTGTVNAITFNTNATYLATGGSDHCICLWDPATGELVARKTGAHKQAITSLAFTPSGLLVSAGQDNRLIVWKIDTTDGITLVEAENPIEGRSGDVAQLGLDPTGENVLFDAGSELRVLSLSNRQIVGSLINSGAAGSFSTLAQFAPDGRTILTNGNGPGRLQLWRAPSSKNRAAEMRQFLWSTGNVTCGAFDPTGQYAVTGTSDSRVLVWRMPKQEEAEKPLPGELSFVEEFLDGSLKRITVRATAKNDVDSDVVPGSTASIVVPPLVGR